MCDVNSNRRIGLKEERLGADKCPVDRPVRACAGINREVRSGWVNSERNSVKCVMQFRWRYLLAIAIAIAVLCWC